MRPHIINFDSILESAFALINVAAGGKAAQSAYRQACNVDDYGATLLFYFEHFQATVSELLISTATKIRILQDSIPEYAIDTDVLRSLDKKISGQFRAATLEEAHTPLTIRETCNKIIHATSITFLVCDSKGNEEAYYYCEDMGNKWFSGKVVLNGKLGGSTWKVKLILVQFGVAIIEYVSILSSNYDIYKLWD
ncbi:MAG: hypothetical protein EOM59_12300 [Clostridia bacterium]|nr:hypothetical protein [Clostridia bacterium]